MTVQEVKKQIQSKRLNRFFVFTGDEIEAQRIYIDKIAEVTGKPVKRIEQVQDAFNRRAGILKISNVFVCRDDMEFWKSATNPEKVNELLGDNILIIQMTTIDKRSKACKAYTNEIVEFQYMDADTLYKYAERECSLSDDNAYALIAVCENDYSRILLEADKIRRYAEAEGITEDKAFTDLMQAGVITKPPQDAIFDFVDAMLRAQICRAFELLEECKAVGESPLKIISVLYTNFKRVLQYQVCDSKDVGAVTGLSAYDIKLAKATAGVWASSDLVYFIKTLQKLEQGVKTGEIEEETVLDLLMVQLL